VPAFRLPGLVPGLRVTELCADLTHIVAGRPLDDDGVALLRFDNGARGVLIASQICTGEENDLTLRVYGDRAGLEWRQQEPGSLWLKPAHAAARLLRGGGAELGAAARAHTRLPSGHPEGYIEAFANVYRNFAAQVRAHGSGDAVTGAGSVPGIDTALRGMAFIDTVVSAHREREKWHSFPDVTP